MTKTINNTTILTIEDRPRKLPDRDEDGEIIVIDGEECDACGTVSEALIQMKDADTTTVLRTVVFSMPKEIARGNDSRRSAQLVRILNRIEDENGADAIELPDKVHDWIHRTLNREIPVEKADEKRGVARMTYAQYLWGIDHAYVKWQLEDIDSRGDFWADFDDED